ncbi:MAG: coiled-coil [archaeon GW2011_AR5]|nr:MAG: coiled-coil [archaeon GW2011_AR5]
MDWNTCVREGNSVKITANRKRAVFLVNQAEKTMKVLEKILIDKNNASVFFTNYYDALLELLHALMYDAGFKVKNHYCLGYYLRDVIKDNKSYRVFDRSRLLRNSSIYYGENFDEAVLLSAIRDIKEVFVKLKKNIK